MNPLPLLLLLFLLPSRAAGRDYAAMLSKGSGPYFEAYLAFQKAFGHPVVPVDLSRPGAALPGGLKAAAAFGSKAAGLPYKPGTRVIGALAPGFLPPARPGYTVISPLPPPEKALAAFKSLQPGLRRLGVIYGGRAWNAYAEELAAAGRSAGIEILPERTVSAALPERLRSLLGRADAFWLLPEPTLIDRDAIAMLSSFSCANKLPFYAPSAGLVPLGATAALAPGFAAAGEAAAAALKRALAGESLPPVLYADGPELTFNAEAAAKCGLPMSRQGGRK